MSYNWKTGPRSYAIGHKKELLASATKSASFNTSSEGDARTWQYWWVVVNVTAKVGSPTLDLVVQQSDDDSNWFSMDSLALPQITVTGNYSLLVRGNLDKRYMRLAGTFGGVTSLELEVELFVIGPNEVLD